MVARRDQRASAQHGIVGLGLFDRDAAQAVEAVGKGAGEQFRHVLHDHDAGRIGGQRFEQRLAALRFRRWRRR